MNPILDAVLAAVVEWLLAPILPKKPKLRHWVLGPFLLVGLLALNSLLTPRSATFSVQVVSAVSGRPIPRAHVVLEVGGGYLPSALNSESNGYAYFELETGQEGRRGRLTVNAESFEPWVEELLLTAAGLSHVVQLHPLPVPPSATDTPGSQDSTPPSSAEPLATPLPPVSISPVPSEPPGTQDSPKVGIVHIDQYIYDDILDRVRSLGIPAQWISSDSDYYALDDFDIVYLPTGWAYEGEILGQFAPAYREFVAQGGGFLVEQPNSGGVYTPVILPYSVTFTLLPYNPAEWPPHIVRPDHSLVQSLGIGEIPGPQNHITYHASEFEVLATSQGDEFGTLLTAAFGKGRIIVTSGTASPSAGTTISDELYTRMFAWLAGSLP